LLPAGTLSLLSLLFPGKLPIAYASFIFYPENFGIFTVFSEKTPLPITTNHQQPRPIARNGKEVRD